MARLSTEQWAQARALWEGDPDVSFQQVGDKFGCSGPAVGQKARKDGWVKGGSAEASSTPAPPKESKVSTPPKVSIPSKVSTPKKAAKGKARTDDASLPPSSEQRLSATDWQLMTGKRPVGRPTDYRPEFVQELIAFFDVPVQSVVESDVPDGNGGFRTVKTVVTNPFPTLVRFASKIGVTYQTLHDWAHAVNEDGTPRRPEFSYAYARARDLQQALLIEGGLAGLYEGRFATLSAKNLIGWKDQVETKNEVNITPVNTSDLDDIYARSMQQMQANRQLVLDRKQAAVLVNVVDKG